MYLMDFVAKTVLDYAKYTNYKISSFFKNFNFLEWAIFYKSEEYYYADSN